MATISYTPYNDSDSAAITRTTAYVLDGHGNNPYDYINQYIADGHGGTIFAKGYGVIADVKMAALQMKAYKEKYKKTHTKTRGTNAQKTDVDVIQMYLSFDSQEKLSREELMQIADELIKKTDLRNYPILIAPHYNTENLHIHLVVCCYDFEGKKKFSMKKERLYELRRTLDYICVEHGLSIVEPELPMLRDSEYAAFYEKIKAEQKVPVVPRKKTKMQN